MNALGWFAIATAAGLALLNIAAQYGWRLALRENQQLRNENEQLKRALRSDAL